MIMRKVEDQEWYFCLYDVKSVISARISVFSSRFSVLWKSENNIQIVMLSIYCHEKDVNWKIVDYEVLPSGSKILFLT